MPTSRGGDRIFNPIIKAKTASYTCTAQESGVTFTNRGATAAIVFTLPAITACPAGTEFTFQSISAYGFTVTATTACIVAVNNAGRTNIACTTATNIIGCTLRVISDGVGWLTFEGTGPAVASYAQS